MFQCNNQENVCSLHVLNEEIIEMFNAIVEDKDIYTAGHSKRVAMYGVKIAENMGLSEQEQITIYYAGLLHDIGKILTPEAIILKPHQFDQHDYDIIKRHAADGQKIVSFISSFKEYGTIIRHHHERFDGLGYPDKLAGEEIPLLSRIMAIADSFDAMTTNRIYKARCSIPDAINEILKCSSSQFDPTIIPHALEFFTNIRELKHIFQFPEDIYQEERFAFFFKDALTNVYSTEYLNYFLMENQKIKHFKYGYFIQIHGMHMYNQKHGWSQGNKLLIEIAEKLKKIFKNSFIFRIFGDDFIILSTSSKREYPSKKTLSQLCINNSHIKLSLQYFDFSTSQIANWEELEDILMHPG